MCLTAAAFGRGRLYVVAALCGAAACAAVRRRERLLVIHLCNSKNYAVSSNNNLISHVLLSGSSFDL